MLIADLKKRTSPETLILQETQKTIYTHQEQIEKIDKFPVFRRDFLLFYVKRGEDPDVSCSYTQRRYRSPISTTKHHGTCLSLSQILIKVDFPHFSHFVKQISCISQFTYY